jgi:hypothetical protein
MVIAGSKGLVRNYWRVRLSPLGSLGVELMKAEITDAQRDILKEVYDTDDASTISQMW